MKLGRMKNSRQSFCMNKWTRKKFMETNFGKIKVDIDFLLLSRRIANGKCKARNLPEQGIDYSSFSINEGRD